MVLLEGLCQLQDTLVSVGLHRLGLHTLLLVDLVSVWVHSVIQSWNDGAGARRKRRNLDLDWPMPALFDYVCYRAPP